MALLRHARAAGHLHGDWVAGDDAYGMVPTLREALDSAGWRYVLDVPQTTPVFTQQAQTVVPPWSGRGRVPTKPRLAPGAPSSQTVQAVAASLPPTAWQELSVAEGAQGPRTYHLPVCRPACLGKPGRAARARLLAGAAAQSGRPRAASRAPTSPMARPTRRCGRWPKSPQPAGSSSPRSRRPKAKRGWTSMRCAVGWAGIITSPWPCWPVP